MEQSNTTETANSSQENPKTHPPRYKNYEIIEKNLARAGITPNLADQSCPVTWTILFGFLLLCSAVYCITVFIVRDAKTFSEFTQSIFMASLATLITFALIILVFKAKKLFKYINDNDVFINTKLKFAASRSIYTKTIRLERKLCEIIFFVMRKMTPVGVLLPFLTYTIFMYFIADLGPAAFELPCPMWFPFGWKNPLGYLIAVAIQYAIFSYALLVGASVIAFGAVSFLYVKASIECIKESLFSIGRCTSTETNQNILERFVEFIQFHSRLKQLISDFSYIIQDFITILFMWSLITLCGAMLMLQILLLHLNDNFDVLLITVVELMYSFGVMLMACELCQRMNLAFDECNHIVVQFEWYLFPVEIQQMLLVVIKFTQQPVNVNFFGSWPCDRETFKYVIKNAFSYFMVLREFYN